MRIGINGFGRIGRAVARVLIARRLELVHVNDPSCDASLIAHAFRSDSVYGGIAASMSVSGAGEVAVNSQDVNWRVRVTSTSSAEALDWQCDAIIDASNLSAKASNWRTGFGARRLILAGRDPNADGTIVLGASKTVPQGNIWAASTCDAVAIAPILKQIDLFAKISHVVATIVHPALSYQRVLDLWPPPSAAQNTALSRSVLNNIIPHETSVKAALGDVLPSLADRFTAMSFRVPTEVVCMASLSVSSDDPLDPIEFLGAIRDETLIGVHEYMAVSRDFVGNSHSAVVIAPLTALTRDRTLQVVIAYDNEWGYASRLVDLLAVQERDGR